MEKCVDERDDDDDEVDGVGKESVCLVSEMKENEDGEMLEVYVEVVWWVMEVICGWWAETRDGGLAFTGNEYW